MTDKRTHEELADLVKSQGWTLVGEDKDKIAHGTLEDVLRNAHLRHKSGERPGLIQRIEDKIELDMIEIEKLWVRLGLPV